MLHCIRFNRNLPCLFPKVNCELRSVDTHSIRCQLSLLVKSCAQWIWFFKVKNTNSFTMIAYMAEHVGALFHVMLWSLTHQSITFLVFLASFLFIQLSFAEHVLSTSKLCLFALIFTLHTQRKGNHHPITFNDGGGEISPHLNQRLKTSILRVNLAHPWICQYHPRGLVKIHAEMWFIKEE